MRKLLAAMIAALGVSSLGVSAAAAELGDFVKPPSVSVTVNPGDSVSVKVVAIPGNQERQIAIIVSVLE